MITTRRLRGDGTWDLTAKPNVDSDDRWPHQFAADRDGERRRITGNGLPEHGVGTYPISRDDDAYRYDRNPNRVVAQPIQYDLPATPALTALPSCVGMGTIGVLLSGSAFFNALDAGGRDALAHELQDACGGHPQPQGVYHYHALSPCLEDPGDGHSALMGYALDGFGIFGHRGEDGQDLAPADLDVCHGHTHAIIWDGETTEMFHYHATWEYPYTIGCFRGQAVAGQQEPGAPPRSGGPGNPPGPGGPSGPPPGPPPGPPRPPGPGGPSPLPSAPR
jgi:YHYH protein